MKLFQAYSKYLRECKFVFADDRDEALQLLLAENCGFELDGNDLIFVIEEEFASRTEDPCVLFEINIEKGVL